MYGSTQPQQKLCSHNQNSPTYAYKQNKKKLVKQQIFNDCYDVKQNKSATRQNRVAKFHKTTPKQTTQKTKQNKSRVCTTHLARTQTKEQQMKSCTRSEQRRTHKHTICQPAFTNLQLPLCNSSSACVCVRDRN